MSLRYIVLTIPLRFLSSSKLALVLVLVVILFSLVGAVLPQDGMMESKDIAAWQQEHLALTRALEPVGFFHVFQSWPFLITIVLLGVNTLTCTVVHFVKDGGLSALKGPRGIEKTGFLLLHLSLILLFTGGFWSAATKLDGYIVLTEGQRFTERHDSYIRLVEGPLRREHHKEFVVALKRVDTKYEKQRYQTDVTSNIEIISEGKRSTSGVVKFNKPFTYKGISFTQDQTGFSPRIVIRETESGKVRLDSFVALKTFRKAEEREYRDFLPLPFLKNRVIITLYPSYTMENGTAIKTGEELAKPLLLVEEEDESGQVIPRNHLPFKGQVVLGQYSFGFTDIRQWSSFRVIEDSGYFLVFFSLWLGTAALLLRYVPDFLRWFGTKPSDMKTPESTEGTTNVID
jgi:hypothetical protein